MPKRISPFGPITAIARASTVFAILREKGSQTQKYYGRVEGDYHNKEHWHIRALFGNMQTAAHPAHPGENFHDPGEVPSFRDAPVPNNMFQPADKSMSISAALGPDHLGSQRP